MYKIFLIIMKLTLILSLIGCSKDSNYTSSEIDKTTISEYWVGPKDTGVASSDVEHCGKSASAKKMVFPGFITVSFSEEQNIYHSTEQVIKFDTEHMIDSKYRLGNLSLWKSKESNKEIYVGKIEDDKHPKEVLVYQQGGCN
ncbi:hypothetical protein [Bacillus sp. EAC]|uniref:hypothetical protein n=1 Tax=Bacillus sp. EAC TaxID=1978338 RepID=UPI000B4481BE|nr:hypothetical protein [Bacillus sp. EAC]